MLAATFPEVGVGLFGVSLAFGLTGLTMVAHAIRTYFWLPSQSSGFHRAWAGGRLPAKELAPHIVAQVIGGIVASGMLYLIDMGKAGSDVAGSVAANGQDEHSPGGYTLQSALITEIVMSRMFIIIILGATDKLAPAGFAPISVGLGLTFI